MTFNFRPRRLSAAAVAGLPALLLAAAHVAAPQAATPAPGWNRLVIGDFEITVLSDGTTGLPVDKLLTGAKPGQVASGLVSAALKVPVETSVNGYRLVNTGTRPALVDGGAAGLSGPTPGRLVANLKVAGDPPEQVDAVLITRLHSGDAGGLLAGDRMAFPSAIQHVDRRDVDSWLSDGGLPKANADTRGFFRSAVASLKPYRAAGNLLPFDGRSELLADTSTSTRASHGHMSGHATRMVESGGQKLPPPWGDPIHVAALRFADPSVTAAFDPGPKAAVAERKAAFAEAARQRRWVAAARLSFPGIGRLRAAGRDSVFVPANYGLPR